jgi:hypothetical protein
MHNARTDSERFDELLSTLNRIAVALEDSNGNAHTLDGPGPNTPPPEPPRKPRTPDT